MIAVATIWSHALAALLFGVLAVWQGRAAPLGGVRRGVLAIGFAATALWALIVAIDGAQSIFARFAESGRNLAWLGFMLALLLRGREDERRPALVVLYAVVAALIAGQTAVELLPLEFPGSPRIIEAFFFASLGLRMTAAIGALLLVHNLYTAASPDARWGIRLPMAALAVMWTFDLNLYTVAYLSQSWPDELFALRGLVTVMLAPLFALASRRTGEWKMRLSRAATFQSLTLMAVGAYLVTMVVLARALEFAGGDYLRLAQLSVIFGMSVMALVLMPSRRVRAWVRVIVSKHLFQHRYDYRAEWLRFTDTLGRPGGDAAPLDVRVAQAIAEITESPGGLLLVPEDDGGLAATSRWGWRSLAPPAQAIADPLARHLGRTGRIIELDPIRRGQQTAEAALIPDWLIAEHAAWVIVPLVHVDRLVGAVLLERPPVNRSLDWEDFDLLRVAGRQVASYLAEARGQEALSEARRFDEFNRRFAFIMHDIKNLVSQLSLVARNAERHADNPAFRADMLVTLKGSVDKMNDLLARLSRHDRGRGEEPRATPLKALVEGVVAAHRKLHPVRVTGRADVTGAADPARLEQAIGHLVQNAIDASAPRVPVLVAIQRMGTHAVIEVIDRGAGMSADFVRAGLFKPFASTKEGGFGIGAFEAKALIASMGGRLEVESREGEGSRFRIVLPIAAETVAAPEPRRMRA